MSIGATGPSSVKSISPNIICDGRLAVYLNSFLMGLEPRQYLAVFDRHPLGLTHGGSGLRLDGRLDKLSAGAG